MCPFLPNNQNSYFCFCDVTWRPAAASLRVLFLLNAVNHFSVFTEFPWKLVFRSVHWVYLTVCSHANVKRLRSLHAVCLLCRAGCAWKRARRALRRAPALRASVCALLSAFEGLVEVFSRSFTYFWLRCIFSAAGHKLQT